MKRNFCDVCNAQINDDNRFDESKDYYATKKADSTISAMPRLRVDVAQPFDVCKYCVVDIIARIDERPQAAAGEMQVQA